MTRTQTQAKVTKVSREDVTGAVNAKIDELTVAIQSNADSTTMQQLLADLNGMKSDIANLADEEEVVATTEEEEVVATTAEDEEEAVATEEEGS